MVLLELNEIEMQMSSIGKYDIEIIFFKERLINLLLISKTLDSSIISNVENDKLICLSQYNNLNILCSLPSDIRGSGKVRNFWDGNGERVFNP